MNYYLCYADINLNIKNDKFRMKKKDDLKKKKSGYYKPKDYRFLCRQIKELFDKDNIRVAFVGVISRLSISHNCLSKWHCHITLISDSVEELERAGKAMFVKIDVDYTSHKKAFMWTNPKNTYNNLKLFDYDLVQAHGNKIFYNNTSWGLSNINDFIKLVRRGDMTNTHADYREERNIRKARKTMQENINKTWLHVFEKREMLKLRKSIGELLVQYMDVSQNADDCNTLVNEYLELENAYIQGFEGMTEHD